MKLPQSLTKASDSGGLVLCVGAGASQPAGAPGWKELLHNLCTRAEKEQLVNEKQASELRSLIDDGSTDGFLIAGQYIRDVMDEKLVPYLEDEFKKLEPTDIHDAMVALQPRGIITTNYDTLIEQKVPNGFERAININDKGQLARINNDTRPWILKLHGTYTESSIVLGTRDYEEVENNKALGDTLRKIFRDYTVLFLGYGLSDPDVMSVLSRLRRIYDSKVSRHYALVPRADSLRADHWLKTYKIQAIPYNPSAGHPEVVTALKSLTPTSKRSDRRMHRTLLIFKGVLPTAEGAVPRLLVSQENPGWQGAYLLPCLAGPHDTLSLLKEKTAELIGTEPDNLKVHLEKNPLISKKFNPDIQGDVEYTFTFATVEPQRPIPHLGEPIVEIGGRKYEWLTLDTLRSHEATTKLNRDVIEETNIRYGGLLDSITSATTIGWGFQEDPYIVYGEKAKVYRKFQWTHDKKVYKLALSNIDEASVGGVLDLGCGTGSAAEFIRKHFALKYHGIDLSPEMIDRARNDLRDFADVQFSQLDFTTASLEPKHDGWLFLMKNVLHLLPHPRTTIGTLPQRFGSPAKLVVVETESPNLEAMWWIKDLFEVLGASYKRGWFVKGHVENMFSLWGANITAREEVRQSLDVDKWLQGFHFYAQRRDIVERMFDQMPPSVAKSMEYENSDGARTMLRLQTILHVDLPKP